MTNAKTKKFEIHREYIKYSQYKDSDSEWLGKLPLEWEVKKLKYIAKLFNGSTPKSDIAEYWDGQIPWVTPDDLSSLENKYIKITRRTITESGYRSCGTNLIPPNNIILSTRAPIGLTAINKVATCTNQGCKGLVLKRSTVPLFYYYVIKAANEMLNNHGSGTTFKEISTTALNAVKLVYPKYSTQLSIANYLEDKIARIDQIISKKQKLIELLREKRTALINQAVTKGLDPNAEMVDSGVEWIGKMPKGWRVKKLKYLVKLRNEKSENFKADLQYIGLENIESFTGKFIESAEKIEPESVVNEFRAGDVLFSKLRPYLVKAFIAKSDGISTGELLAFQPGNEIVRQFLFNRLISGEFIKQVNDSTYGSKMPRASWNFIGNLQMPYPNLELQEGVANFLQVKLATIDLVISKIDNSVRKLEEFKSALISSAVTGKIMV